MRATIVWTLIALSCVLTVAATLAVGIQQVLLNTDRWVAAVGPLAADAGVQTSVASTAAAVTLNALDVQGRVQSLPTPLQRLAAPAGASLTQFVDDQAVNLVHTPQFATAWVELNRGAHTAAVQLLRDEQPAGSPVQVTNGELQLNLFALMPTVMQQLRESMNGQLPPDFGYVSIAPASAVVTAQQVVQFLDRTTGWLIVMATGTLLLAVSLSRERLVTLFRLSAGIALGVLLAGLALMAAQTGWMASMADRPINGALQAEASAVLTSLLQFMFIVFLAAALVALVTFAARRFAVAS
jgi:hypothetical protein